MPIYEYRCKDCGKEFEIVAAVAEFEKLEPQCPDCDSKEIERRWSQVFAVTSKKS